MRIAIGQINPVVGDIRYNAQVMFREIQRAKEEEADLIIFPELASIGYPPKDLLLRSGIFDLVQDALAARIQPASRGIGVIVGVPVRDSLKNLMVGNVCC